MTLFYAKSKDGVLDFDNKGLIARYLKATDTKKLVVQIDRETGVRSSLSNSYLWGVVYKTIADSTGYSETELHEIFKRMFLPPRTIKWRNVTMRVPGSTKHLDKPGFSEYIERIRCEVATMGIAIPEPIK